MRMQAGAVWAWESSPSFGRIALCRRRPADLEGSRLGSKLEYAGRRGVLERAAQPRAVVGS
jgi:hypothetical protein